MDLVDTHCHLDFDTFDRDRENVLIQAWQTGLKRIVNPGIDIHNCRTILSLCDTYPGLFAAVGVHPNSAISWDQHTLSSLRELTCHSKVVAIGEIGLDFYRDQAPIDIQVRIFHEQLALADELGLPVIVHSRQAELKTLEILSEWIAHRKSKTLPVGVLHSYSGNESLAQHAISLGFFIGFTGAVTFRNARQIQNLAATLPLTSLLVETDAPFLTPHPHRGERNEPAFVYLVVEQIAKLHNKSLEYVAEITTANAEQLFQWSKI